MIDILGMLEINDKFVNEQVRTNTIELSVKNFGLSEDEFDHLLLALKDGDMSIFKSIFLSHSADCINYLQIKYDANYDDAYDAMVDTLLNYRQRLVEDKISYGNLRFLFLQMASQHYMRMLKLDKKLAYEEPNLNLIEAEQDEVLFSDEQLGILKKAWNELKGPCQELLKMNYYDGLKLSKIAEKLNKSHGSVRKQKERCKESLINIFNRFSA